MPAPRDGRYAEAFDGLLRSTILDTVHELVADHAWERLSMAAVAKAAGVSRQTLYNEFGDRDGLAEAYIIREAGRFLDRIEEAITAHPDSLVDAFSAAMLAVLVMGEAHPVLTDLVAGTASPEFIEPLVGTADAPVLDLAGARLTAILHEHWSAIDLATAEEVAELFTRLALSYLTQPRHTPAESVAAMARLLGPYLQTLDVD